MLWYSVSTLLLLPLGLLPQKQQVFTVAIYIHIFINNMQLINGVFNIFPTIYTLLTLLYTSGGEQNGQYASSANSLHATAAHHSLADSVFPSASHVFPRVRLRGAVHVSPALLKRLHTSRPSHDGDMSVFLKARIHGVVAIYRLAAVQNVRHLKMNSKTHST